MGASPPRRQRDREGPDGRARNRGGRFLPVPHDHLAPAKRGRGRGALFPSWRRAPVTPSTNSPGRHGDYAIAAVGCRSRTRGGTARRQAYRSRHAALVRWPVRLRNADAEGLLKGTRLPTRRSQGGRRGGQGRGDRPRRQCTRTTAYRRQLLATLLPCGPSRRRSPALVGSRR